MNIHIGDCHKCPATDTRIVFGWKTLDRQHCVKCNGDRLQAIKRGRARTRPRKAVIVDYTRSNARIPISAKPTDALRELREKDDALNKEIWDTRKHECFECGRWLAVSPPPKGYFSHVHSKGSRPDLRHEPRNIVLHCFPKCHRTWETGNRESMPRTLELYNQLSVEFQDNRYNRK